MLNQPESLQAFDPPLDTIDLIHIFNKALTVPEIQNTTNKWILARHLPQLYKFLKQHYRLPSKRQF